MSVPDKCPWCRRPADGNCCDTGKLLAQRNELKRQLVAAKAQDIPEMSEAKMDLLDRALTENESLKQQLATAKAALERITRLQGFNVSRATEIAADALREVEGRSNPEAKEPT